MKTVRTTFLVLCSIVILPVFVNAQWVKYGNNFLQLGYSAHNESLARSAIATTEYYFGQERANPSMLVYQTQRFTAGGSFASIFTGMGSLLYAGFSTRIDSVSGASASLLRFGVDGIQNTLQWRDTAGNEDYSRISRFGVADYAFFLSYGRQLFVPQLAVGGSAKILYRDAAGFANGFGIGFDLSATYTLGRWHFAAIANDITSTWVLWFFNQKKLSVKQEGKELNPTEKRAAEGTAPSLTLAASSSWQPTKKITLGASLLLSQRFDGNEAAPLSFGGVSIAPSIGIWGSFRNFVWLRLGTHQLQRIPYLNHRNALGFTPTAGLGIQAWGLRIDYAFSAPLASISIRQNHLISVSYSFGK